MTQAPPEKPPERKEDDDPIAHLHKMSTTAGLGSGDYVAVNAMAVVALLAGLASTLALADNVLLLVPLVGVVLAIIALVQIAHSNGTQTGRWLAILGLILSLLFAGSVGARAIQQNLRTREDRRAIGELIHTLGKDVREGKFEDAYALFSKRFMERIGKEEFIARIKFVQVSPMYGNLENIDWTGLAEFYVDPDGGSVTGAAQLQLKFDKGVIPIRESGVFRKSGDPQQWRIENLPTIFPAPQAPRQ